MKYYLSPHLTIEKNRVLKLEEKREHPSIVKMKFTQQLKKMLPYLSPDHRS